MPMVETMLHRVSFIVRWDRSACPLDSQVSSQEKIVHRINVFVDSCVTRVYLVVSLLYAFNCDRRRKQAGRKKKASYSRLVLFTGDRCFVGTEEGAKDAWECHFLKCPSERMQVLAGLASHIFRSHSLTLFLFSFASVWVTYNHRTLQPNIRRGEFTHWAQFCPTDAEDTSINYLELQQCHMCTLEWVGDQVNTKWVGCGLEDKWPTWFNSLFVIHSCHPSTKMV